MSASDNVEDMDTVLRYRGRVVTRADVDFIRTLIAAHPTASRRALSKFLCQSWDWRQDNGALRDMVCRGLMLALHRAGHIELPAIRYRPPNPLVKRAKPMSPVAVDRSPMSGTLTELGPVHFCQVRRVADKEALFGSLIEAHHYLGYTQPVGEHLKYLVVAQGRPVAALTWSSAPRHLGPRDRFIGWSRSARKRNIRFIAYNSRFLILPWVQVRHLASHILGRMTRQLSRDWQSVYSHPVYFAETFIDPARFAGTCYRAANWVQLGTTTGRGHNDRTNRANQPVKEVLGYPLCKRFRQLLAAGD